MKESIMFVKKGVKLQLAISMLVIMTVLITTMVNWYSATKALDETLSAKYLESNYNYANKLSLSTRDLLNYMQANINAIAKSTGVHGLSQDDLDTWHSANGHQFNSLFLLDDDGYIQLISPSKVQYKNGTLVSTGMKIQSDTIKKALTVKKPFISEPYQATSGQLIMLISAPVFDKSGTYQGLIGGTIHIESDNVIRNTLNNHEYEDGSYVYVVDKNGRIIYHPDPARINDIVESNKAINLLKKGKSGYSQLENSEGKEFFAGYKYEETLGWGIVSQTAVSVINEPLLNLLKKMIWQSLPLLLITLMCAGLLVRNITKPLNTLAKYSEDAMSSQKPSFDQPRILKPSYIYEVNQLSSQVDNHIKMLNTEIQIDGLTELANRKSFDFVIKKWMDEKTRFSLILLDIDNFKQINDQYGHLTGDDVLKFLSSVMSKKASSDDLCFRYGGEEFGLLLQSQEADNAIELAEQLRQEVAARISPTGKPITISIGVATYQETDLEPYSIVERADAALYQSKRDGKNKVSFL
ncbi:diguanylate cyclase (GGDEF)-like protein [Bacillus ectoiniformans]|uniref:sensor domain-containing diguanylate cyclase n=1 Tax=Bacillus ectoiniformans TaxID=1494429 RepID=UPI001EF9B284|nr:sensor domain-containing diguanylate cyclase [Bacillus ectoiniformans]MBM7650157.1 diguanylate cyclase (GGDEF)-like protein [Bacillus ectoiniformans]